jgi:hypothetical protein
MKKLVRNTLFGDIEIETVVKYEPRGYRGTPGCGPPGETCGTCKHKTSKRLAKTYWKCMLMRKLWTGGYGSDIRLKSPACEYWEKGESK